MLTQIAWPSIHSGHTQRSNFYSNQVHLRNKFDRTNKRTNEPKNQAKQTRKPLFFQTGIFLFLFWLIAGRWW